MAFANVTPGPYDFDTGDFTVYALIDGSVFPMFQLHPDYCPSQVEQEATAELLSASHDVAIALRDLIANLDEGDFISTTRIDAGKAALRRAGIL